MQSRPAEPENDSIKGLTWKQVRLAAVMAIGLFGCVSMIVIGIFTAPVHKEISYTDYHSLKTEISTSCPELRPIVALYIEEYKFISRAKRTTFLEQCDKLQSANLKKQIIQDFSK